MHFTVQNLRRWLLALAATLLVVIAGVLLYSRVQVRRATRDLPGKLGIDIQQSAKEFTFSKSEHGRTLFTLRASKAVQYKGRGRVLLHDFAILLYDKDGRTDRISGNEFEFDPALRLATANGEVHMDLHAPAAPAGHPPGQGQADDPPAEDAETLHVLAHGLVFDQTSGNASTANEIEFRFPQAAGKARGADFDSATGILRLNADVDVTSSTEGREFRMRAGQATYQRETRLLQLTRPVFDTEAQTATAAHATARLSAAGTPEEIHAEGGVTLEGDDHSRLTAPAAVGTMNAAGKLRQVHLFGGVRSSHQQHGAQDTGEARDALLSFDAAGELEHVTLNGDVALHEAAPETRRDLSAERVDASFVIGAAHRAAVRQVTASGNATAHMAGAAAGSRGENTTLSADKLLADLGDHSDLKRVHGSGHARLVRSAASGASQTSSSDDLLVDFAAMGAADARASIVSAVERGNVVIQQVTSPAGGSAAITTTANAAAAEYRARDETVTLTGTAGAPPRLADGALDVSAARMVLARMTGDVVATGTVKGTYMSAAKEPPLHVVADRGEMFRSQQRAVFTGHARLWQQDSSIEAPVLELARTGGKLLAHDLGDGSGAAAVHGVFLNSGAGRAAAPVRISSQRLAYSDADRVAEFTGSTVVESADAKVHADQAVVTLRDRAAEARTHAAGSRPPAPAGAAAAFFPGMSAAVERIVSTGHILLQQPTRSASGSRLVYTAADGRFVLTGTPADPPKLTDAMRGTVTGSSLIFLSRDESVQVGDDASGITTTRTRVPK